ncbi:MAG TPA: hypothetical protein VEC39_08620 [Vicinamibacterales bacterium]|nr:hypothetical protein [Vicinamibacterales bacterium]
MTEQPTPDPAKEVAFYTVALEAWIANQMEKDKTLLALASGAIGLLVTLLTTAGPTSSGQLWLYGLAGLSFISTVVLAIKIFDKNCDYLMRLITKGDRDRDPVLAKLDAWMFRSFILGVAFTCAVAAWTGYEGLGKEKSMTKQYETKIVTPGETKSLSGLGNLAPAPAPAASVPASSETTGGASSTPAQPTNASPTTPKQ